MRLLLINILIVLMSLSLFVTTAEAKRFGGGKSFGMSRQASSFNKPSSNGFSHPSAATAATKPASTASKWLGPLAGLAAGGLLASLFMGHGLGGLGGGIFSWILLAAAVFFGWRLLRNLFQMSNQTARQDYQQYQANSQPNHAAFNQSSYAAASNEKVISTPTDFNEADFLRSAKATFIRLQTAYDNKNLTDIREFTAPEVFAEIQLQIQERGDELNHTEVVSIDAELLDVTTAGNTTATVLFTGSVREEQGAAPVSIKEMWHFNKDLFRSVWIVAGIQQA